MDFLKKIDLKTILILGLVIVILLMRSCDGGGDKPKDIVKIDGKKYQVIKHVVDTQYVPTVQIEYRDGKTIYVDKPVYVPVPSDVDTTKILQDYYTKYTYKDTLNLKDSLGYISVIDTIYKNKIFKRTFDAHVNKITIKDILIVEPPSTNQFFIGGVAGFDKVNVVNFVGPTLVLKTKKDKMYSLGIGYSNSKSISIQGGMYWKIKLKK
jgi:hypothetical protein